MNEAQELKKYLWDWKWRVTSWNLYKIRDKNWDIVPFIPNQAQLDLLENVHYKNLILKARQLGFSTLIQILMLDQALFNNDIACWVIAQWLKEAKNIFDNKIKFAYDHLPSWLKEHRSLTKNSSDTLEFNNWSSIYVSVTFRWWTLQYLHISEYGKICAKYPDRAREINTWALEAVWAGNYVFIESTAEWKSWDFYDKARKSEELHKQNKILNEHEYKFFFYPWYEVKEYSLNDDHTVLTQETIDYFNWLETDFWIKVTDNQKKWYQVKKAEKQDDMLREYPSVPDEAFKVAIMWSYYKKWINKVYEENRLCRVPIEPALPIYLAMDLWWAWWWDDMTARFFQIYGRELRFVDYWEWSWFSMQDFHAEIMSQKNYNIHTAFLPHDAEVHSQNDWKTRSQTMRELGYNVYVLQRWWVSDRIQIVRDNFKYCWFDKQRCWDALDWLWEYKRKWSDSIWDFLNQPDHNNSHNADWFGYAMIAITKELRQQNNPPQITEVDYSDFL